MKQYPRISSHLYAEPWMMLPEKYQEVCRAFEQARKNPEFTMAADDPVGPKGYDYSTDEYKLVHPQLETFRGSPVALARVKGVTGRGLSKMAMQCGGFDTGLFREQLRNVLEDESIRTLVIDFNSPGGLAAGNLAVAQDIEKISAAGKRVIGWCGNICCSAAYFMAAACDEFHADRDAFVGSISTIYAGVDSSKAWEKEGLELKLFATGKFKATGISGKEWTEEEEREIWNKIRGIDDEFKGYVRQRRGLKDEDMEGQWWYAGRAPQGVVDSTNFESLEQVLEAAFQL